MGDNQLAEVRNATRPGIALALGGGFARGFAHLGVLKVLEQNHIPISFIVGTSVGSVFGAAYASGAPLARILAASRTIRFREISLLSVSRSGLLQPSSLADLIEQVSSQQFQDVRSLCAVVRRDLATGDPVIFRRSPPVKRCNASCAFPGLFEPIQIARGVWPMAASWLRCRRTQHATGWNLRSCRWRCVGVKMAILARQRHVQVVARAVAATQKHQQDTWELHPIWSFART
jgi:hypothetical protein